jgi:glycosyltransferase involved in cell wall biosynthesis
VSGLRSGSPARVSPVGLVHDWLTGQRGGENVLLEIAKLFPAAPIHTLFHFPGTVDPEIESHPIETSFLQRAPGLRPGYRWYLPLYPAAIEDLDVRGHRLLISSSHCVAKGATPGAGAFHVCYCHTPMRYAWDQEEAYFGRGRGPVAWLRRRVLAGLRRWDVATAGRVHRYLANSSFVADRIRRYYGRDARVLPPPVDTAFFTPGPDRPREHVLVVAALAPYKKVDRAIEACAMAGLPLVVVGEGPERGRLERLAGPGVRFAGRVPPETLRALYRSAICLLQPGIEDFGIAAVEALACGTPVAARGLGGVLDIVRDGTEGILFEGDDRDRIRAAIDKIRGMQSNFVNLRERAESFSAGRFAQRLREMLVSDWPDAEGFLA